MFEGRRIRRPKILEETMSEGTLDKDAVIASLMESNDLLREENQQIRNNNRILRRVHSALRSALASLRNQVAIAHENDKLFKELCSGEFDAEVTHPVEGGLPETGSQVEPAA